MRARAYLTTGFVFVQKRISPHIYGKNPSKAYLHRKNTKNATQNNGKKASTNLKFDIENMHSRDRIVVSTLRCGRNNPGSNPGHVTF